MVAEARLGLRQRVGRGPWAVRLDALAGVDAVQRWTHPVDAPGPLDLDTRVRPAPIVAAQLSTRSAGFELGWTRDGAATIARAALVLRWPGVVRAW
ncbi:MAG: hypothetical protein R3F59_07675 [Myxococcota bacterium]